MFSDDRGLSLTTGSAAAADAFAAAVRSSLSSRTDSMEHMNAALAADPDFVLANALKGTWLFSLRQPAKRAEVRRHLDAALAGAAHCTERERLYAGALEASLTGNIAGAISLLEQVVHSHPTDIVALRLAQFELFWLGEARWALAIVERAAPAWTPEVPGYSAYLASLSFAQEEAGRLADAERSGRRSIEIDPGDCWAAHSVAHVMEMRGDLDEGIEWLDSLKAHWAGANHIVHHLWWHRCLFESERGNHRGALDVYDEYVRNPASPLVQAMPDFFLDIQNCAALLLRLELRGVEVGDRWEPIADIAEARIGNHSSPFTSAHCAIALVAAGREDRARALLDGMKGFAREDRGTLGPRYAVAVIPAAKAMIAHRRGDHEKVLRHLMPARRNLWQMGGSHAQRDLFFQIACDSAARLRRRDLLSILANDVRSIGFDRLDARTSYAGMPA